MPQPQTLRQRAIDYQEVFNSPGGRRVLVDLMKRFHVLQPSYDRNPHETAFREGERNAVLYILTVLNINEDSLLQMIKEMEDARPKPQADAVDA